MTYKEAFMQCKTFDELKERVKTDTCLALVFGSSERVKVIETAMNEVIKEKGWEGDDTDG